MGNLAMTRTAYEGIFKIMRSAMDYTISIDDQFLRESSGPHLISMKAERLVDSLWGCDLLPV